VSKLWKTTIVEGKLFLREPLSVGFGVLFPSAILLALGAVPALREPSAEFDGARFVEFWAPTALVIGLAILGVQHLPGVVATYRENGILRRLSTTPVHPAQLLVAQLVIVLAAAVAGAVLLLLAAWLLLGVPLPDQPLAFMAAFLVGFGAVLALGLLVAAVAPNARGRQRLGGRGVHAADVRRRGVPAPVPDARVPGAAGRLHATRGAGVAGDVVR
jgi:ABC-2 type transport system permease protein